LFAFEPPLA
ncbi:hypothetical protein D046_7501B, partial [Vibrio parahaemolyticus V-223/04]